MVIGHTLYSRITTVYTTILTYFTTCENQLISSLTSGAAPSDSDPWRMDAQRRLRLGCTRVLQCRGTCGPLDTLTTRWNIFRAPCRERRL